VHGDLHPRNLLVEQGAISGVIDWGDITSGDRATDLVAIWMLFDDPGARQEALAAYGDLSAATLARARGWALHLGAVLLDTGLVDNPRHAEIGERTLRRLAQPL
jgi:aminoglycoside phosphotransferase (APT) family kinase protein